MIGKFQLFIIPFESLSRRKKKPSLHFIWQEAQRDQAIRLGISASLSIRQLSRLTGIGKTSIERVII